MDFVGNSKCSTCKGVEKCNNYCSIHAGKALVDFLNRVDMIETRIGEYSSRTRGGDLDLVVYGHQLHELNSPSWLLGNISITLDASNKFKSVFDKTPVQIINNYCSDSGISNEEVKEIINKLTKLNKNKLIILPFKPHTVCNLTTEDGELKDMAIKYIRWETDKTTYKLNCVICFHSEKDSNKQIYKFPVTDYIDKFRLSSLEIQAKSSGYDKSLIKITDYGIIKPIEIEDKGQIIAIDGSFVYSVINGATRVVGYWDENDNLVFNVDTGKSKAYKKIIDNTNFIKHHKKYMAPYMMYESNVVKA